MKRAFIYTRVSTLEQAKGGYSISEQESRLKAFAEAKGYEVVKVYTDPGHSGAKLERPALQEMIKNIERANVILVYKLDRLSRSQKDTLYLIEEVFIKNNVDFISLNESFDTSSSFGRAMIGILSVFAQLEREQIKERFAMGREGRAKSGKWYGGGDKQRMIVGYDYVKGELVINEYESACVRMIYDLRLKGLGLSKIWDEVQNKYPGVLASVTTVDKILKNDAYVGIVNWKGKKYAGDHIPILDKETFDAVQKLPKRQYAPKSNTYILSGVLKCGYCDSPVYASSGGVLKDGTRMNYYRCRGKRKYRDRDTYRPHCTLRSFPQLEIESYVVNELKKLSLEDVEYRYRQNNNNDEIRALQNEINKIDKQIARIIDLFSIESIDFDDLNERLKELNKKKDVLKQNLNNLQDVELSETEFKNKIKTLSKLNELDFDSLESEKKRLLIAKLINKITTYNDNIIIEWAF